MMDNVLRLSYFTNLCATIFCWLHVGDEFSTLMMSVSFLFL